MKLYDLPTSPNCLRVRVLARELGLPIEIVPMDFARAKQPGYLEQNPAGKVPTFVDDDGFVLWESGAILAYLADKKADSGLLPGDAQARADVLRWMFFLATHLQPWLSLLGVERLIKARSGQTPDPVLTGLAERELARFLPIVDAQLAAHDYLGERYTIADIAIGCSLESCEARGVDLGRYPNVTAWRERLRRRPAWHDPV
jgi:glutathione S-transferase